MTDGARLSQQDRDRIAAAVKAAEASTSAEIHCVLAGASDDYFHPSALALAAAVFVASALWAVAIRIWWVEIGLVWFVAAQAAAFVTGLVLLLVLPALRVALTPKRILYRRAHANAVRQFLSHNIHLTEARTGVLVFVSLAERYAEIVADRGIDAKVQQSVWDDAVAVLVGHVRAGRISEGYVETAQAVGEHLARHFPRRPEDRNELDDRLVEI